MGKLKKFAAGILCGTMALSMAIPTFADTGTLNTLSTSCTFTYKGNGGTTKAGSTSYTQSVTKGKKAKLKTNSFLKTGYTFMAWNTKSDGSGTTAKAGSKTTSAVTSNATYYAQWKPVTYYVYYYTNGGSGKTQKQTLTYDISSKALSNSFKKTGYTFTGWNTNSKGNGTGYAAGATLKNLASVKGKRIGLYAQWKANSYTVKFDANGGTGTMASETFSYAT